MEITTNLINHESKALFIPVKKVAHSSLIKALNPITERAVGIHERNKLWDYTHIMIVREPMDRFNSFYRAERPSKKHLHPDQLIDDLLFGHWANNSHAAPQTAYIVGSKFPDIIIKFEELKKYWHVLQRYFPGIGNLPWENRSPRERDIFKDFNQDQLRFIRGYYHQDYEVFDYAPRAYT